MHANRSKPHQRPTGPNAPHMTGRPRTNMNTFPANRDIQVEELPPNAPRPAVDPRSNAFAKSHPASAAGVPRQAIAQSAGPPQSAPTLAGRPLGQSSQGVPPHRRPPNGQQSGQRPVQQAPEPEPPANLETFKIHPRFEKPFEIAGNLYFKGLWEGAIQRAAARAEKPEWQNVATAFETIENKNAEATDKFNELISRYNDLISVKSQVLEEKRALTAQYLKGGESISEAFSTLEGRTRDIEIDYDPRQARMIEASPL